MPVSVPNGFVIFFEFEFLELHEWVLESLHVINDLQVAYAKSRGNRAYRHIHLVTVTMDDVLPAAIAVAYYLREVPDVSAA
jgi:hypothetical protein